MHPWKAAIAVVATLAAVAAAAYGSGYIIYLLLGIEGHPLHWNTAWHYFAALGQPAYEPYAWRIKLGIGLGCGLPGLVSCAVLVGLFRSQSSESAHGDARLASATDLRKAGLFRQTPESILIGRYKGRYLWLGGAQHVITISPTRSGKTTSVAIPVVLTYQGSVVVLDVKGELHKTTSGWRESLGQVVRVWAPYDENGNTHRFNPMTLLAGMSPARRIGELQTMAAILYPDQPGGDPFWTAQSRAAFTAFASFLFESWDEKYPAASIELINSSVDFPSFERILNFSSGKDGQSTRAMLGGILKNPRRRHISPQTRTVFNNLVGLADDTFSSVIATMQAPLQQFLSPVLAAATNATDIDVRSLRRTPTSLYVIIPTNKLDESSKLLNIFFSTVIGNNLDKQLREEPELRHQMLMLMDEFTAMGRVDVWAKRISISASYGVRDLCIVQSRSQLRATYGDHDAQNFITNHGAQVAFAPREQADANEYSEMLGYKTVRKRQRSTSTGGGSRQVSTSFAEEKRALMLPQEVKDLPADEQLIFYEGCKPIRARKNWFFKDKGLLKRASLPPAGIERAGSLTGIDEYQCAKPATAQGKAWLQETASAEVTRENRRGAR
ncbi:type IV secretory system conjugative DNA transfer family protein [Luteibacter jiangsuensis]|uniref:Type IV secretory system conjugative DNA transfer family protein n=1 Tax=Luteibacter jiangsuensis TaxID=637577 RepID=A0ABX0Q6S3_9GAMM|nr:type IV secretory system conjugative DNA transfer family protein [Luteibacter jiangsuensis]NID05624.1 type IV secretory system conjugative DNA transfer family protein [Luteibacter jiangsuensis]